jgi:hypothetical protein
MVSEIQRLAIRIEQEKTECLRLTEEIKATLEAQSFSATKMAARCGELLKEAQKLEAMISRIVYLKSGGIDVDRYS